MLLPRAVPLKCSGGTSRGFNPGERGKGLTCTSVSSVFSGGLVPAPFGGHFNTCLKVYSHFFDVFFVW